MPLCYVYATVILLLYVPFIGGKCGLRFNPGRGSGGTGKTNVGGPSSSFGIWFEHRDKVKVWYMGL